MGHHDFFGLSNHLVLFGKRKVAARTHIGSRLLRFALNKEFDPFGIRGEQDKADVEHGRKDRRDADHGHDRVCGDEFDQ